MLQAFLTEMLVDQKRKEVNAMQKQYEAPEVTLIGQANQVVMGGGFGGGDNMQLTAPDFEFEHDWPLI